MSTAGGVAGAPARAGELGANALQLFTSSPRQWRAAQIGDEEACLFRRAVEREGIQITAAHDSYLINLASHRPDIFRRSREAFAAELERCALLGIDLLVTHPGNATGGNRSEAMRQNAQAIAERLDVTGHTPVVLFETTAGSGSALGWRFEELAELIQAVPEQQRGDVGVCMDTAHVFAAGYDVRKDFGAVLDAFDGIVGLARLRLLHVNDSVAELGSRRDRHAHIGEGRIGTSGFRALMSDPRISWIPRIIETPKDGYALENDRRNLDMLRRLASSGG